MQIRLLQWVYNDERYYLHYNDGDSTADPTAMGWVVALSIVLFGFWMCGLLFGKIGELKYYCGEQPGFPKLTLKEALLEFDFWKLFLTSLFYLCCIIVSIALTVAFVTILTE